MTASNRRTTSWAGWVVLTALLFWGAVHIAGGISLLIADATDGLETLGPNVTDTVPTDPGDAAQALLRFHSLNIALGGVAVLALAVSWWRERKRWQLHVAVVVAAALDVGLIAFFVVPNVLPASQGLIGPVLVLVAVAGTISIHRTTPTRPGDRLALPSRRSHEQSQTTRSTVRHRRARTGTRYQVANATEKGTPMNPQQTLQAAIDELQRVIDVAPITPEDGDASTPCSAFTVDQLLEHIIDTHNLLLGGAGGETTDASGPIGTRHAIVATAALKQWDERGLEGTIDLGGNELPAGFGISLHAARVLHPRMGPRPQLEQNVRTVR